MPETGSCNLSRNEELNEQQKRGSLGDVDLLRAVDAVFVEDCETSPVEMFDRGDVDSVGIAGGPRLSRCLAQLTDQRQA